jgi:branched-subunit amino acid transport protein AzlD
MRAEVLTLALAVRALTWAFRYLPLRMSLHAVRPDTALGRFLAATGPAAIATLFVAAVLPYVRGGGVQVPLIAGVAAVLGVYFWRKSVVLATLAGAVMFGVANFMAGV